MKIYILPLILIIASWVCLGYIKEGMFSQTATVNIIILLFLIIGFNSCYLGYNIIWKNFFGHRGKK
ncbi:hypothetical protein BG261_06535 [Floricoccus tropicus]|uniref:Uncharacterized protein n=1 Tax=Floricoccus tropicus TaxID=1859473 RepID=A0A1E8GJY0_9LACT|nr:hypothetical protein BG261_06535 [Floricoccus tropicus]